MPIHIYVCVCVCARVRACVNICMYLESNVENSLSILKNCYITDLEYSKISMSEFNSFSQTEY